MTKVFVDPSYNAGSMILDHLLSMVEEEFPAGKHEDVQIFTHPFSYKRADSKIVKGYAFGGGGLTGIQNILTVVLSEDDDGKMLVLTVGTKSTFNDDLSPIAVPVDCTHLNTNIEYSIAHSLPCSYRLNPEALELTAGLIHTLFTEQRIHLDELREIHSL